MNRNESYHYLPTYGKCAIDWLDANYESRTRQVLRSLLDAYARTYGLDTAEDYVIESAEHICSRRFANFT